MITIDQKIAEFISQSLEYNGWPFGNLLLCAIALVLSLLLCGAIGLEREKRGRTAGLRTHLLVGVGSCIIMIISIYGFPAIFVDHRDVARLAAQVVAGVGFLGAGVIIYKNGGTRGLTTAGTIWISMAIGIACGSFNFVLASVGTIIIMIVLVSFRKIESRINGKDPYISVIVESNKPALKDILDTAKKFDCSIHDLSIQTEESTETGLIEIIFRAKFENHSEKKVVEFIAALEDKLSAREIQLLNHKA